MRGSVLKKPVLEAPVRLCCFPYAGGRAASFAGWQRRLRPVAEVIPVEYPGRGRRYGDRPIDSMSLLVADLANELQPILSRRFVFFGHSMGALVSFELTRELRRRGMSQPDLLILSGARAPQTRDGEKKSRMTDKEFVEMLKRHGATPPQVLSDEELLSCVLPILRSDFTACEYSHNHEEPLNMNFTVFGGTEDDEVQLEHLQGWRVHTHRRTSVSLFPGNHFFVRQAETMVLDAVYREVLNLLRGDWEVRSGRPVELINSRVAT